MRARSNATHALAGSGGGAAPPPPAAALPGGRVTLRDLVPGDDVPPRLQVLRAAVLVREVVRVLPDVVAEDRRLTGRDRAVLVRRARHIQLAAVEHEPGPTRAELVRSGRLELLLEVVERPERARDRIAQLAARFAAAIRAHPAPEERVVVVAAGVVADRRTDVVGQLVEAPKYLFDRLVSPFGALERPV